MSIIDRKATAAAAAAVAGHDLAAGAHLNVQRSAQQWHIVGCPSGKASGAASSTTRTSIDTRKSHVLALAASEIRLYYRNAAPSGTTFSEIVSASELGTATVTASVELPTGENIPVLFGGNRSGVCCPLGYLISDPISIGPLAAGFQFFTRTRAVLASGKIVTSTVGGFRNYEGVRYDGADLTGGAGTTGYTVSTGDKQFYPVAVFGNPIYDEKSTLFVGDSIVNGENDSGLTVPDAQKNPPVWGWARRAALRTFPAYVAAFSGGACSQFIAPENTPLLRVEVARFAFGRAVIAFGANDLTGGTLAGYQAAMTSAIALLRGLGIPKIYISLVLPRTTSTDSWATTANQTPVGGFEVGGRRDQANEWINSRCGGLSDGVVDTLSGVSSGAAWLAGMTTDGAHPLGTDSQAATGTNAYGIIAANARVSLA